MFHTARWRAYPWSLQAVTKDDEAGDDTDDHHHQITHHVSPFQWFWFLRDEDNGHQKAAMEHLERCDILLEECSAILDALEETLSKTPKPSEAIDWCNLW